jgi:hypothetical protein
MSQKYYVASHPVPEVGVSNRNIAWRAGTKSANLAQPSLKLRLLGFYQNKAHYRTPSYKNALWFIGVRIPFV